MLSSPTPRGRRANSGSLREKSGSEETLRLSTYVRVWHVYMGVIIITRLL